MRYEAQAPAAIYRMGPALKVAGSSRARGSYRAKAGLQGSSRRARLRPRGFTLLEMLAVVVLAGVIALVAVRVVSSRVGQRKWDAGKAGVTRLDRDVRAYVRDNGSPPKTLEALLKKPKDLSSWRGPYAKSADLTDPFGHRYAYIHPDTAGRYDIIFYGADGKPGGKGINRDYGGWH